LKGNELLNAAFPHLEGTNIMELKDADGQLFVKKELEILKKALVDGEILVVGCCYYPPK